MQDSGSALFRRDKFYEKHFNDGATFNPTSIQIQISSPDASLEKRSELRTKV